MEVGGVWEGSVRDGDMATQTEAQMARNRRFGTVSAAVMVLVLASGAVARAEGQPAAKATAKVGTIGYLDETDLAWTPILSNVIKTSSQKDLFVDVSLECGLRTKTLVKSKGGAPDTSAAEAGIDVRVLVDHVPAAPGEVTFCRRDQELTATFQGLIEGCLTVVDGVVVIDETCLKPEELELILDTMNANSFNFVLDDVGVGTHTVTVEAKIDTNTASQAGLAEASGTIGKGSMTVEEVRLIKNEDITLL